MKKILLLNPPGKRPYLRDYYCGDVSKGRYYWPPLDLLIFSGILKKSFQVSVLDCIVDDVSDEASIKYVASNTFDAIIAITGCASKNEDLHYFRELYSRTGHKVIISGDYCRSNPAEVIAEHPYVQAIILNFTFCEIVKYLHNPTESARNIYSEICPCRYMENESFDYSVPQYELFHLKHYRHPLINAPLFGHLITEFGCYFSCSYCFYEKIRISYRNTEGIKNELNYLIAQGCGEVLLSDASFGGNRTRAFEVIEIFSKLETKIKWVCSMRADHADFELLAAMKNAGCHCVMFGIESNDVTSLVKFNRKIDPHLCQKAFNDCRNLQIETLAHFILGLPGIDERNFFSDFKKTVKLLNPNFISINLAVPAWGSSFREKEVIQFPQVKDLDLDISGQPLPSFTPEKQMALLETRRRCYRYFYFRIDFIRERIRALRNIKQFNTYLKEALALLRW